MPVNIYSPRFMIDVVESTPPLRTFLKDTFFRNSKTFPTEAVDFDVKKGGMAMAPFVHPRIGSTVLERQGFTTETYKPPLVAPKRVLTTDDLDVRLPGEALYNGYNANKRMTELLTDDLLELDESITRREEWMCAHALFEGGIPVVGEGINQYIDFGFENTIAVDVPWTDFENSKPMEDLQDAKKVVSRSGHTATIAIADEETMWDLMRNEEVQKFLDIKNYNLGIIEPEVLENGATYIGYLRKCGLRLYSYGGEFADNDNINPAYPDVKPEDKGFVPAVYPLVPKGKVLVAPARNFPAKMLYAVIKDLRIGNHMRPRVPKQWDQEEPSERYVKISSRPLPCPQNLDAYAVLDVV